MKFINDLNVIQTISFVGVILSIIAQIILTIVGKEVETFWAIYPTWAAIFILGTIIKKYVKDDHHHH